jgi:hypothetical protein
VSLAQGWLTRLRGELPGYARLAMENIALEFPAHVSTVMTAPEALFTPRSSPTRPTALSRTCAGST